MDGSLMTFDQQQSFNHRSRGLQLKDRSTYVIPMASVSFSLNIFEVEIVCNEFPCVNTSMLNYVEMGQVLVKERIQLPQINSMMKYTQTIIPEEDGPPYAIIPSYITAFQSSPVSIQKRRQCSHISGDQSMNSLMRKINQYYLQHLLTTAMSQEATQANTIRSRLIL